jgi:hypothetical protein
MSLVLALAAAMDLWFVTVPDLSQIGRDIVTEGPWTVPSRLWGSRNYDEVLWHAASGDKPWVALAPLPAPGGVDADAAEAQSIALAEALSRNAAGVLHVLDPARRTLSSARVFGVPFIEGSSIDMGSYAAGDTAAVSTVSSQKLQVERSACLAAVQ